MKEVAVDQIIVLMKLIIHVIINWVVFEPHVCDLRVSFVQVLWKFLILIIPIWEISNAHAFELHDIACKCSCFITEYVLYLS